MRGWRAFYADGRTLDSATSAWRDLPERGVVGVVVFQEPPYRRLVYGGDWFYLDTAEDTIRATATTWDGWVDRPDVPPALSKRGEAMPDAEWRAMRRRMLEDTTWP